MRVGVYQNHPKFGQTEANVNQMIQDLSSVEADLLVLPELFNTGYQFAAIQEMEKLAEEIPSGKTCQAMTDFAKRSNLFVVFGLAETDGRHYYNSAAVIGPDGWLGVYRKTHLFFEEKDFFSSGDTGFCVFDIGWAKIGVMICFDWWFPESARTLALKGADIICHPANLILPGCQEAMKIRSLENGVFSLTANRVGTEARKGKSPLTFTGQSQVVDNSGEIKIIMGRTETGVRIVDIDPLKARNKALTARNDRFEDRRPEFYGWLTEKR